MPDETLEKAESTSSDSEMKRVSETPLTFEMEETTKEKPLAYAKHIVKNTKIFFGKFIYAVLFSRFQLTMSDSGFAIGCKIQNPILELAIRCL